VQNGGDPMTVLRDAGALMSAARITRLRRGSDGPFDASAVGRAGREVPRYDSLPRSLVAALEQVVRRDPDAEAVVEVGGTRLSYAELWQHGHAIAGGLRAAGISPGDRVAIDLPNGVEWVVSLLGIMLCGVEEMAT